jgi:cell wall-associated NlpC family hydrolase
VVPDDVEIRATLYPLQQQVRSLRLFVSEAQFQVDKAQREVAEREMTLRVAQAQASAAEAALTAAAARLGVNPYVWSAVSEADWWRGRA